MTRTELREAIERNGFDTNTTVFTNIIEVSDKGFKFGALIFHEEKASLKFVINADLEGTRERQLKYLVHKFNDTLIYDAILIGG